MKARSGREIAFRHALPAALGLAAAALVVLSTSRYGIGLAPDSANYVSAARSLLAGRGLLCLDGTPFTSWPPLYPVVLALPGLVGIDIVAGARFLHAVAFGALAFLSVRMLRTALRSGVLITIGALFVLLSNTLLSLSAMLLSEIVFCLLALLFLTAAARLAVTRTAGALAECSVLGALLCLQRYVGLALVVPAVVILLAERQGQSPGRRFASAGIVLGAAVLPVAGWMARNYLVTGTLAGERMTGGQALLQKAAMVLQVIRDWFVPTVGPGPAAWVLTGILAAAFCFLLGMAWYGTRGEATVRAVLVRLSLLSLVVYLGGLVGASSLLAIDEISARLLAPVYVLTVLLLLVGLERTRVTARSKPGRARLAEVTVATVCAIAVLHPLNWTARSVQRWRADGIGGYTHRDWQESELLDWLRQNRLQGRVLSNDPAAVYLLAGIEARMSLRRTDDVARMCREREMEPGDHLVWFYGVPRPYLYQVGELHRMLQLEVVHSAADGAVLALR